MTEPSEHQAFEADFSDYYERLLPEARTKELEQHLAKCEQCKKEYDGFREAIGALSGLHKVEAPRDFNSHVAETINRRSGGLFFGRRAFGDRVPFGVLAIICLVIVVAVLVLLNLGGGRVDAPLHPQGNQPPNDNIKNVVPTP
jgi:anti-sigma factor RsiW